LFRIVFPSITQVLLIYNLNSLWRLANKELSLRLWWFRSLALWDVWPNLYQTIFSQVGFNIVYLINWDDHANNSYIVIIRWWVIVITTWLSSMFQLMNKDSFSHRSGGSEHDAVDVKRQSFFLSLFLFTQVFLIKYGYCLFVLTFIIIPFFFVFMRIMFLIIYSFPQDAFFSVMLQLDLLHVIITSFVSIFIMKHGI
jgi:hypothetical protein